MNNKFKNSMMAGLTFLEILERLPGAIKPADLNTIGKQCNDLGAAYQQTVEKNADRLMNSLGKSKSGK